MNQKKCVVLWQYDWVPSYAAEIMGEDASSDEYRARYGRSVRFVGWYFRNTDDEPWKLSVIHMEEQYPDCMNEPSWHVSDDSIVNIPAFAELLRLAGKLPIDEDISEID